MRLPIVVLGNSDRRPGPVPLGKRREDMLSGYKGTLELPWGRTLVGELIDRIRRSERFQEPLLLGPRHVYEGRIDCEIVHVEGNLSVTLSRLRRLIRERFDSHEPLALCAYDVLPTPEELRRIVDEEYAPHAEACFWWQLIRADPESLGASGWKQSYPLRLDGREQPARLYPGHFGVLRPATIRLRLLNHFLSLAYRHRTELIRHRVLPFLWHGIRLLLLEDWQGLIQEGKLPRLTLTLPWAALMAYWTFRRGRLSLEQLQWELTRFFVHRQDRFRAEHGPVRVVVSDVLSMAKDFDTRGELDELVRAHGTNGVARDTGAPG